MIRGWPAGDPILPRPFDIVTTDIVAGTFRLCIKVEGRGTALISRLRPDDEVLITGPLGKPIAVDPARPTALLVRGAGAAAVVFLAETLARLGGEVSTILSASTRRRLVCRELLAAASTRLLIATDDASEGYGEVATDLLDGLLAGDLGPGPAGPAAPAGPTAPAASAVALGAGRPGRVYTCGSRRFARHVKRLDQRGALESYVFLEGLMACGMGDCHGCAVKKDGGEGYLLVCKDGPVFRSTEVELE
jgi:dihydroorotate dehydrogenase electron transfer subunit